MSIQFEHLNRSNQLNGASMPEDKYLLLDVLLAQSVGIQVDEFHLEGVPVVVISVEYGSSCCSKFLRLQSETGFLLDKSLDEEVTSCCHLVLKHSSC